MSKNTDKIPKFCDPYSLPDIFILNLNYLLEIQKSSALFIYDSMSSLHKLTKIWVPKK